jgi:ligand-binding SRPBCC domain-containing protein
VWEFISSPANLREITPDYMDFRILSEDLPEKMYAGMIIKYRVRPIPGFATTWVTEITHVEDKRYFVDEQRMGPYALWHHQHHIEPHEQGVLMTDIVSYRPPFGFIGILANNVFIRKQLTGIFDYRERVLKERYS